MQRTTFVFLVALCLFGGIAAGGVGGSPLTSAVEVVADRSAGKVKIENQWVAVEYDLSPALQSRK
jgi:hypothetical protein